VRNQRHWLALFILLVVMASASALAGVSGLRAEYRKGQVFLVWKETGIAANSTLNVYTHPEPITADTLAKARRIGHFIWPASGRDWTRNLAAFERKYPEGEPVGFVLEKGGEPIDHTGGLFVHTITKGDSAKAHYAVTVTVRTGKRSFKEEQVFTPGANSLAKPVAQSLATIEPIWRGKGPEPKAPAGLPVIFILHGRTGGRRQDYYDYIFFGPREHGWREGLAHIFRVEVKKDAILIIPADRAQLRQGKGYNTFWYGYNENFYSTLALAKGGRVINYSERRLLWLMDWIQRTFKTDPNRVYMHGSSMGGCGGISMALHHPDRIAAVYAHVPILSYTDSGPGGARGSMWRISQLAGPKKGLAPTDEAMTMGERMNGLSAMKLVKDLPFLYIVNGRTDKSIPWYNCPPFYKALNTRKHGTAIYWDNEAHGKAGRGAPADVLAWRKDRKSLLRFRSNQSFPAFTNCSANNSPGNGLATDGDLVGWINRGMAWEKIVDEKNSYAITLSAAHPGLRYPVTVDMTPQRIQKFKVMPGETVFVSVGGAKAQKILADDNGLVTVPRITLASEKGVRVELKRVK
jgi:S-formylglutathione hydrolase FrmB